MESSKRRLHLTDRAVRSLAAAPAKYDVTDATLSGFGVRVQPNGTKLFWVRWWDGARRSREYLGEYGEGGSPFLTLAAARTKAAETMVAARRGELRAAEAPKLTFGEAATEWLEVHSKPTKKTWLEDERIINRYLLPWFDRTPSEITRRDASLLLDPLLRAGKAVMARQVKAVISAIFNRLLDLELVASNPVVRLKLPKRRSRDRVLTDDEIRRLWPVWGDGGAAGALYQFLLLTGLRSSEATNARWEHLSGQWLEVPETKTDQAHRVYLAPQARELLTSLRAKTSDALAKRLGRAGRKTGAEVRAQDPAAYRPSPWIFDSPRQPGRPFYRASQLADVFRAESGTAGWTAHDLRRTCATQMGRLGIEDGIVDRCLGHAVGKITRTYNKARYEGAMAEAWAAWGQELQRLIDRPPSGE